MNTEIVTAVAAGGVWRESDVRSLRNNVFGSNQPDESWNNCKIHWMLPENIKWLLSQKENEHSRHAYDGT